MKIRGNETKKCEICGAPSNGMYTSIFGTSELCLKHGNEHPTIAYRPYYGEGYQAEKEAKVNGINDKSR